MAGNASSAAKKKIACQSIEPKRRCAAKRPPPQPLLGPHSNRATTAFLFRPDDWSDNVRNSPPPRNPLFRRKSHLLSTLAIRRRRKRPRRMFCRASRRPRRRRTDRWTCRRNNKRPDNRRRTSLVSTQGRALGTRRLRRRRRRDPLHRYKSPEGSTARPRHRPPKCHRPSPEPPSFLSRDRRTPMPRSKKTAVNTTNRKNCFPPIFATSWPGTVRSA